MFLGKLLVFPTKSVIFAAETGRCDYDKREKDITNKEDLFKFYAKRLDEQLDKLWVDRKITPEELERLEFEHLRTEK